MLASAQWTDREQFVTHGTSGHAVVFDSDRDLNTAPGPMEMVLRSLCACSATDVVIVLRKRRQPFTAVAVRAEAERAEVPPQVFRRIRMVYSVVGAGVDRAAVDRAAELSHAKYCSVMAMLHHDAEITYEIELVSAESA